MISISVAAGFTKQNQKKAQQVNDIFCTCSFRMNQDKKKGRPLCQEGLNGLFIISLSDN